MTLLLRCLNEQDPRVGLTVNATIGPCGMSDRLNASSASAARSPNDHMIDRIPYRPNGTLHPILSMKVVMVWPASAC
jgi:hypothetical protein